MHSVLDDANTGISYLSQNWVANSIGNTGQNYGVLASTWLCIHRDQLSLYPHEFLIKLTLTTFGQSIQDMILCPNVTTSRGIQTL